MHCVTNHERISKMAKIKGERVSGRRENTVYTLTPSTRFDKAAIALLQAKNQLPGGTRAKTKRDLTASKNSVNMLAIRLEQLARQRHIEVAPDGTVERFTNKLATLGF